MSVCPTQLDIPKYIEGIYEGRFSDSLATIRKGTCLAGTLGRVCVRPCESNCRRANIDESVAIKHLKRFAADYEIEKNIGPAVVEPPAAGATPTAKKVAILGAGPAGLSCAYYLVQMGYEATVFEKLGEPGGMAAVGIPDYRLPETY
jgi:formate dehydrogenase beta subunit